MGLGAIAQKMHLPVLKSYDDVIIPAVAEKDPDRGEKTTRKWNLSHHYTDYQEMYEESDLDAVFICLPNHLHYPAVKKALENDLHVFCEKPMGLKAEEAKELVKIAHNKDLTLAVGYNRRLGRNYQKLRKITNTHRLGKVLQIHGILMNPGPYGGWIPSSDWFLKDKYGVLYDSGSHLLDLMMYVLSDEICELSALGINTMPSMDILDNITGVFKTNDDIIGSFNVGWRAGANIDSVEIHGTGCSAMADYFDLRYRPGSFRTVDKISENLNSTKKVLGNLMTLNTDLPDVSFFQEDRAFLDTILNKGTPIATGEDAVKILIALEGLINSIEDNKLVKI